LIQNGLPTRWFSATRTLTTWRFSNVATRNSLRSLVIFSIIRLSQPPGGSHELRFPTPLLSLGDFAAGCCASPASGSVRARARRLPRGPSPRPGSRGASQAEQSGQGLEVLLLRASAEGSEVGKPPL